MHPRPVLQQGIRRPGHQVAFQHIRHPLHRRPDGTWHRFDPRNIKPRIKRNDEAGGRDAADVPLIHSFGLKVPVRFGAWADEVRKGVGLGGKQTDPQGPGGL